MLLCGRRKRWPDGGSRTPLAGPEVLPGYQRHLGGREPCRRGRPATIRPRDVLIWLWPLGFRSDRLRGRVSRLPPASGQLLELAQAREDFLELSKAANTLRAYRSDWRDFSAWCAEQGLDALPAQPETLSLYLAARAGLGDRAVTIQRRVSAISQAHQAAGYEPSPTSD
jgi:hypothetical protein